MILNYASMLQQMNMFEDSFKVFERATVLFNWPNSFEIWLTYISTMIQVLGGSKLERVRHVFDQCLKECPQDKLKLFLLMNADFEENFGLISRAMDVYDRATRDLKGDTLEIWNLYIAKAT